MPIIKRANKSNFTTISNDVIANGKLSLEAKAILMYLLSKPDSWEVQFSDVEAYGRIGRDKREKIFRELEAEGYFERVENRRAGKFGFNYLVHETPKITHSETISPCPENAFAVNELNVAIAETSPCPDLPLTVRPLTVQPSTVKPRLSKDLKKVKTERVKTELVKTELENTKTYVEFPKTEIATERDPVTEIFDYWKSVMAHPNAKLHDDRRRVVKARLKDGFTVDEIKLAIDGCKLSPHHQGLNDRQTVYDDLELICRKPSQIEKFINFTENSQKPNQPPPFQSQFTNKRRSNADIIAEYDYSIFRKTDSIEPKQLSQGIK